MKAINKNNHPLRRWLAWHGISSDELGKAADLTGGLIRKIYSAKCKTTKKTARNISMVTNIPVCILMHPDKYPDYPVYNCEPAGEIIFDTASNMHFEGNPTRI